MYLLGLDIGSSSVKASILDGETGGIIASVYYPKKEMAINSLRNGWAEQSPEIWWENIILCLESIKSEHRFDIKQISAIGISYQMHGLVCVDKNLNIVRPSIIWCDSRAVDVGNVAFNEIGTSKCLNHLLNSPGNFTASKLRWVKENEPEVYKKIHKIMLPGDYVAMKLTGNINTTTGGLSEGTMWDFKENKIAGFLLDYYEIDKDLIPDITPTFGIQGTVSNTAARETGLKEGIPISYRAGDQPNNAFSLNVTEPGEIAATAGTSGVVYAISDSTTCDPKSRFNMFAHVNHAETNNRLGALLCINGTGIANSWIKSVTAENSLTYNQMNQMASEIPIGCNGLSVLPFGNGAERVLENKNINCQFHGINFNSHKTAHIYRAIQEGIVFALNYGIDIMKSTSNLHPKTIRAGHTNMFQSEIFTNTLAGITNTTIELYNTDGSVGAARGAGLGANLYSSSKEAFNNLKLIKKIIPDQKYSEEYLTAYNRWLNILQHQLDLDF